MSRVLEKFSAVVRKFEGKWGMPPEYVVMKFSDHFVMSHELVEDGWYVAAIEYEHYTVQPLVAVKEVRLLAPTEEIGYN